MAQPAYKISVAQGDYARICAEYGVDSAMAEMHRMIARGHGHDVWCLADVLPCHH